VTVSLQSAGLQLRALKRLLPRGRGPLRARLGPLDERLVFVIGSPRSGTTFLGSSVGSLPGFVDLGEVAPFKAAIPKLAGLPADESAPRLRSILDTSRRLGLLGGLRTLEQTPEAAFVSPALAIAYPAACFVHIVRDGRDVVSSLLERGWLSAGRGGGDDARQPYGADPRFWVEDGRGPEFARASDARRAAWAWRRYVEAARGSERSIEVRYEELAADPESVATTLAAFIGAPMEPLAKALRGAHASSIGRFRRDLTPEQVAEVETEAGDLLEELGYLRSV
jgi:Sulfotransferase family